MLTDMTALKRFWPINRFTMPLPMLYLRCLFMVVVNPINVCIQGNYSLESKTVTVEFLFVVNQ